jgi:hypothetical protein
VAEPWWEQEKWAVDIVQYVILMRAFLENRLPGPEFQLLYFAIFKGDDRQRPREIFEILDRLFAEIDDYCYDDELRRRTGGMDEDQLRERVRYALDRLSAIVSGDS